MRGLTGVKGIWARGVARRRGLPGTGGYLVKELLGLGDCLAGRADKARRVKRKEAANASHKAKHTVEFISQSPNSILRN